MCIYNPDGKPRVATPSVNLPRAMNKHCADGQGVTIRSSHSASDKGVIVGPDRDPGSNPGRRTLSSLFNFLVPF